MDKTLETESTLLHYILSTIYIIFFTVISFFIILLNTLYSCLKERKLVKPIHPLKDDYSSSDYLEGLLNKLIDYGKYFSQRRYIKITDNDGLVIYERVPFLKWEYKRRVCDVSAITDIKKENNKLIIKLEHVFLKDEAYIEIKHYEDEDKIKEFIQDYIVSQKI
jgi:hypothetical protein